MSGLVAFEPWNTESPGTNYLGFLLVRLFVVRGAPLGASLGVVLLVAGDCLGSGVLFGGCLAVEPADADSNPDEFDDHQDEGYEYEHVEDPCPYESCGECSHGCVVNFSGYEHRRHASTVRHALRFFGTVPSAQRLMRPVVRVVRLLSGVVRARYRVVIIHQVEECFYSSVFEVR